MGDDWFTNVLKFGVPLLGGVLAANSDSSFFNGPDPEQGYQGGIPDYTGIRQVVPDTYDPNRRSGSGGQRYFTDMQYVPSDDPTAIASAWDTANQQAQGLATLNAANPAQEAAWDPDWYLDPSISETIAALLEDPNWSDDEVVQQVMAAMEHYNISPYMLSESTGVPVSRIYNIMQEAGKQDYTPTASNVATPTYTDRAGVNYLPEPYEDGQSEDDAIADIASLIERLDQYGYFGENPTNATDGTDGAGQGSESDGNDAGAASTWANLRYLVDNELVDDLGDQIWNPSLDNDPDVQYLRSIQQEFNQAHGVDTNDIRWNGTWHTDDVGTPAYVNTWQDAWSRMANDAYAQGNNSLGDYYVSRIEGIGGVYDDTIGGFDAGSDVDGSGTADDGYTGPPGYGTDPNNPTGGTNTGGWGYETPPPTEAYAGLASLVSGFQTLNDGGYAVNDIISAVQYANANQLTMQDLAQATGYSPEEINSVVDSYKTAQQTTYLTNLLSSNNLSQASIDAAIQYLNDKNLTVGDIAALTGLPAADIESFLTANGIIQPQEGYAGGGYVGGDGDGMADSVDALIDGGQQAALSSGEFVVPADVVSHLGNGNSERGASMLYNMMDNVRTARTGTPTQSPQIDASRFLPGVR